MQRRPIAGGVAFGIILAGFVGLLATTSPARASSDLGWGTPTPLALHPQGDVSAPATIGVAMGPGGTAFTLWRQTDGVSLGAFGNLFTPGGGIAGRGWTYPTRLNSGPYDVGNPRIAADGSGDAIAVWTEWDSAKGWTIFADRYVSASGWTGPVAIDDPTLSYSYDPYVAMNAAGTAFVAWEQWDNVVGYSVFGTSFTVSGGWGAPRMLDTDVVSTAEFPAVAVDPTGNAMVVWMEYDGAVWNIAADRYLVGTGWLTPVAIDGSATLAQYPRVVLDGSGNGLATWFQYDGVRWNLYGTRFTTAGGWVGPNVALESSANGKRGRDVDSMGRRRLLQHLRESVHGRGLGGRFDWGRDDRGIL